MSAKKRDLISLMDFESEEIEEIVTLAGKLKNSRHGGEPQVLKGRTGVLIFEKPSLRTRVTFETAIYELGGHPINLEPDSVGIGKRETVADIAHNLERWVDLIVARTFLHSTVLEFAKYSSVPVINALSDTYHPCQSLALALTIAERTGDDKKVNIAFIGDGNNVCMSHMALAAKLGYNLTLACPGDYTPNAEFLSEVTVQAQKRNATITVVRDPVEAVKNADFIYTDVFTSMGQESEAARREKAFAGYQVNSELLAKAPSHALVSHCLPAHRGEEISADVMDGERMIAFDEAENRLHVQKAAIAFILS